MNWDYIAGYFDGEGSVWAGKDSTGRQRIRLVWSNCHRESLEAMQQFIGLGNVHIHNRKRPDHHSVGYNLMVQNRDDCIRVMDELISRCLVKHDALVHARAVAETMRSRTTSWGNVAALGKDELQRLYDSGLTQKQIGAQLGVTQGAVKNWMRRHGLKVRPRGGSTRIV